MALVSLDKDADSFIERAGLNKKSNLDVNGLYSLDNAVYYVNWLVKGIKDIGAWDCFKDHALYLHLGGTEEMTAVNLCNDNFNIDWFGDIEFIPSGIKGNGSNAGGDSNLNTAIEFTDSALIGTFINQYYANGCVIGNDGELSGVNILDIQGNTNFVAAEFYFGSYANRIYNRINKNNYLQVKPNEVIVGIDDENFVSLISGNQFFANETVSLLCRKEQYNSDYGIFSNSEMSVSYIGKGGLNPLQLRQFSNLLTKFNRSLNRI